MQLYGRGTLVDCLIISKNWWGKPWQNEIAELIGKLFGKKAKFDMVVESMKLDNSELIIEMQCL